MNDLEKPRLARLIATGHKVSALNNILKGLISRIFPMGKYQYFEAKGAMPAAVGAAW